MIAEISGKSIKKGLITKEREMYNPPEGGALHMTSTHRRGPLD